MTGPKGVEGAADGVPPRHPQRLVKPGGTLGLRPFAMAQKYPSTKTRTAPDKLTSSGLAVQILDTKEFIEMPSRRTTSSNASQNGCSNRMLVRRPCRVTFRVRWIAASFGVHIGIVSISPASLF